MAIACGERYRVYIETSGGMLAEIDTIAASITVSMPYSGLVETEVNLRSIGPMSWALADDFIKQKTLGAEWKCEFCGGVNPRSAKYCGEKNKHAVGCGATRSFIYD